VGGGPRAQSHRFHEALAEAASQLAGPVATPEERIHLREGMKSLSASDAVVAARMVDTAGREIGSYQRAR
jgi:hypothetical protein